MVRIVGRALESGDRFNLDPSVIRNLNQLATEGATDCPGVCRSCEVEIDGSTHTPPRWQRVTSLVDEMCRYVNENWDETALHLAAYLLWRVNWIHPFVNGNGRTARAISYAVLCIRIGFQLPGTMTIPEQIANNKTPYYHGLDAADAAYCEDRIDVTVLEDMISSF